MIFWLFSLVSLFLDRVLTVVPGQLVQPLTVYDVVDSAGELFDLGMIPLDKLEILSNTYKILALTRQEKKGHECQYEVTGIRSPEA